MRCVFCGSSLKILSDEEAKKKLIFPVFGSGIRYCECLKCGTIYKYTFCSITGRFVELRPVVLFKKLTKHA